MQVLFGYDWVWRGSDAHAAFFPFLIYGCSWVWLWIFAVFQCALFKVLIRFGEQLLGEELFELGHFLAERAELRLQHAVLGLVLRFVWVHIVAVIHVLLLLWWHDFSGVFSVLRCPITRSFGCPRKAVNSLAHCGQYRTLSVSRIVTFPAVWRLKPQLVRKTLHIVHRLHSVGWHGDVSHC